MPIYVWYDKLSGLEVDILRDFDKYKEEPTDEDLPEKERGKERDWEKHMGTGIRVTRGRNWSGSKGNW